MNAQLSAPFKHVVSASAKETGITVIGGVFGLAEPVAKPVGNPDFLSGKRLLLANARSALAIVVQQFRPRHVWLPSYLCDSLLNAVDPQISVTHWYPIDRRLQVATKDWLENVKVGDLVVLVNYFGFGCPAEMATEVRRRNAYVLEDAAQALLSTNVGHHADFVAFSPRKFVGIPDGGILQTRGDFEISNLTLECPPTDWWNKALASIVLRRHFDRFGGDRSWFSLFRDAEAEHPTGAFAMSSFSQSLLEGGFDYNAIAARRRDNYKVLLEHLQHLALYRELPDGVIPLGFPLRLPNRDAVRQALYSREIYPPVHWPLPSAIPAEFTDSRQLSSELLTIPCDQRYTPDDMRRVGRTILEEASR